ncbi:MAG: hypothetical protein IT565_14175 [Rhodospirillales bacterium]|nr:hypothetical protein [Rhodospirillales bacterium]
MRAWIVASLLTATLLFFGARHGYAETPPAIKLDDKSTADQILDALHARGDGLKDFSGNVTMDQVDPLTGDTTTLSGNVWFQELGNTASRMRVSFTGKKIGSRTESGYHQEYMLDNGWLIDRDYKRKNEVSRQVLKSGQKINLLKLGEGPFPLPIGQPREEVLKQFAVKRVGPAADDPTNTVHVELAPREGTRLARKFKKIDVFVDTTSNFPRQIVTIDPREAEQHITRLPDMKLNGGVGDKDFTLDPIDDNWTRKSEPMTE